MRTSEKELPEQPSYELLKSIFHTAMHEIGVPVNGVVTAATFLKREIESGDKEFVQELLQMIFSAANNLNEIFERVREVVRQENQQKYQLMETHFDFRKWLDNVLLSMSALFLDKEISVVKQVPREFPPVVFADKVYLTQIIYNLLMNALKYSPAGTVVSVACFVDASHFGIEVTDQGIGISSGELPLIFQEYRQLSSGFKSQLGGIGLGLAIVKNLTEAMNGTITVRSEEGAGSTFTVTFPLKSEPA
ncbi:HAMP domain-containing histidine kinase [Chitinophaga agrisoli]|uniref:histidine kinase n=1 Tax=Chitinophaga agrisoli TaxID=2607653 RepID=A0A5B2VYE1_9BACT|nr:HAMP domain-containing sensor histidine kinase [Chitinophaga agrisoli]KAA2243570.1 HAMP domain-containing histidine kinase [Chitinophaga agrisoli]